MNDDELEHELRKLRPAVPPSDYLRRLRHADPAPVHRGWSQVCRRHPAWTWSAAAAALLLVTALLAGIERTGLLPASHAFSPVPPPGMAHFDSGHPPEEDHHPTPAWIGHDAVLDSNQPPAMPGNSFAMLGHRDQPLSGNRYDLEVPTGPMRLDCGLPPEPHPGAAFLGQIELPTNQPF